MDLVSLRIFVDVAQAGSFAEVARRQNLDPSSVSRIVAGLERDLAFRLFNRSTRRLSLTEAGEAYLERVGPLIDELADAAEAARDLSAGPSGALRLSASVAYGQSVLTPLLGAFRAAYPGLTLDLLFTDAVVDLVAERIDLAIRLGPRPQSDHVASKLAPVRYCVCASPDYLDAHGRPDAPLELRHHQCLRFPFPGFRERWKFRRTETRDAATADEIDVPVDGAITISSALALRRCAINGLGPALLADWLVADDLANERLVDLFPDHTATATEFDIGVWLIYPSRRYLPRKTRVFVDFLRAAQAASRRRS